MKEKEIRLGRSIWPDVDGPYEVNKFLEKLGIKVSFLLDDGLLFTYNSEKLEPVKIGEATLYFRDTGTKENLFHYYEDFDFLVFEALGDSFKIPIIDFPDYDF